MKYRVETRRAVYEYKTFVVEANTTDTAADLVEAAGFKENSRVKLYSESTSEDENTVEDIYPHEEETQQ